MAGRPPKPLHLHVVEGTYRPHRHRRRLKGEPKPVGSLGEPPAWFTEAQRQVWAQQLRDAPAGLLRAIDHGVYGAWVIACDFHRQALEELNKLGPEALVGPSGNLARVLIRIINGQASVMLRLASEMGFSPVSRGRVTVDPRVAPNPFDEFA